MTKGPWADQGPFRCRGGGIRTHDLFVPNYRRAPGQGSRTRADLRIRTHAGCAHHVRGESCVPNPCPRAHTRAGQRGRPLRTGALRRAGHMPEECATSVTRASGARRGVRRWSGARRVDRSGRAVGGGWSALRRGVEGAVAGVRLAGSVGADADGLAGRRQVCGVEGSVGDGHGTDAYGAAADGARRRCGGHARGRYRGPGGARSAGVSPSRA